MAGDELVAEPSHVTNHAVTIWAQAVIWPWLVQMGELPRGGFYSYEWIQRLLGPACLERGVASPRCPAPGGGRRARPRR